MESPTSIGKYCSNVGIPQQIHSISNVLLLEFSSKGFFENRAIDISYETTISGCGGMLTSIIGSIESPLSFEHNKSVNCMWQIKVSKGSSIVITLLIMLNHANNYIELFDGPFSTSSRLAKFSSTTTPKSQSIETTGNILSLRMHLAQYSAGYHDRFSLEYRANCQRVITTNVGYIETPNYPDLYPRYTHCQWTIKAPVGRKIIIDIESYPYIDTDCDSDNLRIMTIDQRISNKRSNESYGPYCADYPKRLILENNYVVITFKPDWNDRNRGFSLKYNITGR